MRWGGTWVTSALVSTLFPGARSQCLKPEDVAEAVLYVLSTPPHVQVSLPLALYPLGAAQVCPGSPLGGACLKSSAFHRLETSR